MKLILRHLCLIFMVIAVALASGCGHGQDFTPFIEEAPSDDSEIETEEIPMSADRYASIMTESLAIDMLQTSADILESLGFVTLVPSTLSATPTEITNKSLVQKDDVFKVLNMIVQRFDSVGNTMSAKGNVIFVRQYSMQCALYSTLDIEYNSYGVDPLTPIDGTGQARVIITSHSCNFHENVNVDIILDGNFSSGEQFFDKLISTVKFESGSGVSVNLKSAEISYQWGTLYCSRLVNSTYCGLADLRKLVDYCSPEQACDVTEEGHEGCMSTEYEETGAHCDLGCCAPLPEIYNVCNNTAYAQRDCNPATESFYTADYLLWGENLVTYEAPLRCSDDGIWTPPCPLDGSYDVCPYGGTCIPPDDEGWGLDLEEFGYCSCTVLNR